ncbi:MAG: hypothetical protein HGA94_00765, partial [Candidatus Aminicenantes bacterium]|nr:hypothetical protein [Candidatus Aminicenantes bacterium]
STANAVDQLGDITQVDLPEVGKVIKAGETCGTIESVKSVSDLFAPVSGEVVKVNEKLTDSPEVLNETLGDIAENLKMLGLNASLEATRAGEKGEGFQVVALELRRMVVQSGPSANPAAPAPPWGARPIRRL